MVVTGSCRDRLPGVEVEATPAGQDVERGADDRENLSLLAIDEHRHVLVQPVMK